jgi:hypothetical protein
MEYQTEKAERIEGYREEEVDGFYIMGMLSFFNQLRFIDVKI